MNLQERKAYLEKQEQEYRARLKELTDERTRLERLAEARKARVPVLEREQVDVASLAIDVEGNVGRSGLVARYGSAASELALIPLELERIDARIGVLDGQVRALQNSRSFVRRRNDA